MEIEKLKEMTETELMTFIRSRLTTDAGCLSFEMSGYETETGECTVFNLEVLNRFADLGIYDFTHFLFLDFYKGGGTLYLVFWYENDLHRYGFCGETTSEIILFILQLTVLSNRIKRRRL